MGYKVWAINAIDATNACSDEKYTDFHKWWKETGFKGEEGSKRDDIGMCQGFIYGERNICRPDTVLPNVLATFPYIHGIIVLLVVIVFLSEFAIDTVAVSNRERV